MLYSSEISDLGLKIFGTAPPKQKEIETARRILENAPTDKALAVASYIMSDSHRNEDNEPYNAEWKIRSNPLIVAFFIDATNYNPSDLNDQVKWCAAFVNWCLKRAGRDCTNSASSGSFRCFGDSVTDPVPGDVAVFKNRGQDKKCSGSGHVSFWLSSDSKFVECLGGNQGNKVKISRYPEQDFLGNRSPWLIGVKRI